MRWLLPIAVLLLAGCDDDDGMQAVLLGGGQGGSTAQQTTDLSNYTPGQPITTMSSEFGYVDDPNGDYHGNGDPGTGGNFYTGAGGQYIGGKDSTGISLPAATEIAIYGSTAAAQNQQVQVTDLTTGQQVTTTIVDIGPGSAAVNRGVGVDLTFQTARQLGVPVNGSHSITITPLSKNDF